MKQASDGHQAIPARSRPIHRFQALLLFFLSFFCHPFLLSPGKSCFDALHPRLHTALMENQNAAQEPKDKTTNLPALLHLAVCIQNDDCFIFFNWGRPSEILSGKRRLQMFPFIDPPVLLLNTHQMCLLLNCAFTSSSVEADHGLQLLSSR